MLHDFDDEHGGVDGPCDGQGFMSYGSVPQQWSTCSKEDFLAHFNQVAGQWCLSCESLFIQLNSKDQYIVKFSFNYCLS